MNTATIHTAKPPGWKSEHNPRIDLLAPFGPQLEQFTKYQLLWLISKGQRKPRFSALSDKIWTVNHHALLCAYIEPSALWHDAAEAFLGDWPTPIKTFIFAVCADSNGCCNLTGFSYLEHYAQVAIEHRLRAQVNLSLDNIKAADRLALQIEDLMLGMGITNSPVSLEHLDIFKRLSELSTEEAAQKWLDLAMESLICI